MCILLDIYRSAMRCGKFGVLVCKASMLNWRRGWEGQSAIGICALFYICIYRFAIRCAKFGVAVFKASMLDCREAICHGYMCIVLYMNLCGVMVLHRSMLTWRRGSVYHRYMCIVLYIYIYIYIYIDLPLDVPSLV